MDQVLQITRLVQLFEYMMRNLYEPPKQLLEQVQTNIFKRHSSTFVKFFTSNTRTVGGGYLNSQKFYSLYPMAEHNNQAPEVPKLDGLACSFILGTPDSLDYNILYQSLIDLLQVFQRSSFHETEGKPKIEKNLVAEVSAHVDPTMPHQK